VSATVSRRGIATVTRVTPARCLATTVVPGLVTPTGGTTVLGRSTPGLVLVPSVLGSLTVVAGPDVPVVATAVVPTPVPLAVGGAALASRRVVSVRVTPVVARLGRPAVAVTTVSRRASRRVPGLALFATRRHTAVPARLP